MFDGNRHVLPLSLFPFFVKVNLMRMKKKGMGKRGQPVPMTSRRHVKEVRITRREMHTFLSYESGGYVFPLDLS